MRVKKICLIKRLDGFFEFEGRRIPAVHPGDGYGVALVLEPSVVDQDFGCYIVFLSEEDRLKINELFHKSDKETLRLLRRPWKGPRPFGGKLRDWIQ